MKPIFIFLAFLLCGIPTRAAEITPIAVTETSLATLEDATLVSYTVVEIMLPELSGGKLLQEAFLVFNMDVSSTLSDSLTMGVTNIEVARMPELVAGKLDVSGIETFAVRTVRVGSGRKVRIYVTDLLQKALDESEESVVLLVGAISGGRDGRFETQAIPDAGGASATLTIYLQSSPEPELIGVAE